MNASGASGPERPRSSGSSAGPSAEAPPLPIEGPLVRAVRNLEAIKSQTESLLLMLEHMPGQGEQIGAAMNDLVSRTNAASAAVWQYAQIRSCEGQG